MNRKAVLLCGMLIIICVLLVVNIVIFGGRDEDASNISNNAETQSTAVYEILTESYELETESEKAQSSVILKETFTSEDGIQGAGYEETIGYQDGNSGEVQTNKEAFTPPQNIIGAPMPNTK